MAAYRFTNLKRRGGQPVPPDPSPLLIAFLLTPDQQKRIDTIEWLYYEDTNGAYQAYPYDTQGGAVNDFPDDIAYIPIYEEPDYFPGGQYPNNYDSNLPGWDEIGIEEVDSGTTVYDYNFEDTLEIETDYVDSFEEDYSATGADYETYIEPTDSTEQSIGING